MKRQTTYRNGTPYASASRARFAADVIRRRIAALDDRIAALREEHAARYPDRYTAVMAEKSNVELQEAIAKRPALEARLVEAWDARAKIEAAA